MFDLKEILKTIESICKDYTWFIYFIEIEGINKNQKRIITLLDELNNDLKERSIISWDNLELISESINQTIDMDLEGVQGDEKIIIKAVDTSYWEIEMTDNRLLEFFNKNYSKIEYIH